MQLNSVKNITAKHCFFLVLSVCFLASYSQAEASHNIHIEWTYDNSQAVPVEGFRLYQENNIVCNTTNPSSRAMDCDFESPSGTFNFYLSAYSENNESPLSAPFSFTLQDSLSLEAKISTNISDGELPLTVTLDAGNSQGAVTRYIWSFGDGTANVWSEGNKIAHTYYTAGQYTASVTVIDSNNNRDTKSLIIEVIPQEVPPEVTAPTAIIRISGKSGIIPFSISLDGSGSTAGSGEINRYIWNFHDNTRRAYGATTVHTYSIPETYNATLVVIDSNGLVDSTSVTVVVANPSQENVIPKADFTYSIVQLDDTLILHFDATPSVDSDGQIINYVWNFGNSSFQTGQQVTHTFPVNQVHSISLTVTDNTGAQNTKSMSTITLLKDIQAAVIFHINSLLLKKHNGSEE